MGLGALVAVGPQTWPALAAGNRYVATTGSDGGNDCSNPGSPCATIQHAISQSASGDVINLGPGKYVENVTVNQNVTIQGGPTTGSTVDGNQTGSVFTVNDTITATLSMLTITNGNAGDAAGNQGGGIQNNGTLTVVQSTINGNTATTGESTGLGGGIFNHFSAALTVINSTISGNSATAGGIGGGICNQNAITVINSTISGNSATASGFGGGLFNVEGATATLVNVTINGNTAGPGRGGGLTNAPFGTLNFTNTIISSSSAGSGDCVNFGAIGTNSHNLVQDGGCSPAVSGNPKLGPLQNNGGPTFTHALMAGSPAIDAGDDAILGSPNFLTTEQRGPGFPRKANLHVDIGAFEFQGPIFNTCLKDNSSGNLLQWNSVTGQYKFTRCSDGFMITGTGVVKLVNGIQTLTDFKSDRRISAGLNTGQLTGNATIYLQVAAGVWQSLQIVATNPSATCSCGP